MENKFKALTKSCFDQKGVHYSELDERAIRISYETDNIKGVDIVIVFDEEDDPRPYFVCSGLVTFPEEKLGEALIVTNTINNNYRWTKFYIDDVRDLIVRMDAIVSEESAGEEIYELMRRMVSIIDDSYPEIMKVRFS